MTESSIPTSVLIAVVVALWGIALALIAVVWGMLREQNRSQGERIEKLETQNTNQEVSIGRLTENARGREEIHAQHREAMTSQFSTIHAQMTEMNRKLDTLLRGSGRGGSSGSSPYPGIPRQP